MQQLNVEAIHHSKHRAIADSPPERVRRALLEQGLETPMRGARLEPEVQLAKLTASFTEVLNTLGLDLGDDSLRDTPRRMAKMYIDDMFAGLDYSRFPNISVFENKMRTEEMVKVRDISLTSTCEHHFVTIDGVARVAYIPGDKIIGLSKINRIVRFFAQRPQVQERLTRQILVALQTLLDTQDVAVSIDAVHYCVKARGVRDESSRTETSALGGIFKSDRAMRAEFLA
ncbi:MAG: GTP cyclohydrolase I FolE [Pseudomonadales bacterium]